MAETRLYHAEVFFEDWFKEVAVDLFNNNYSNHLRNHFTYDNGKTCYGISEYTLDTIIDELINGNKEFYLYEVEVEMSCFMTKCVVRTSYNDNFDVSIVFGFYDNDYVVKTAWLNSKDDTHRKLDKSKYYTPQRRF